MRNRVRAAVLLAALALFGALPSIAQAAVCGSTTWTLWAGQTKNVGTVTVSNDETNLYIRYQLDPTKVPSGATSMSFGTLHAWAGNDLANLPANPQGTPIPGQVPFVSGSGGFPSAAGTTDYTFTIPLTKLQIQDVTKVCGMKLFVVTHAEVK